MKDSQFEEQVDLSDMDKCVAYSNKLVVDHMRRNNFIQWLKYREPTKQVELRGCPNDGPCFCTGVCKLPKEDNPLKSNKPSNLSDYISRGGTRKIVDFTRPQRCMNTSHHPPSFKVYSPGVWEHTCPGCGHTITFTVPLITCHKQQLYGKLEQTYESASSTGLLYTKGSSPE